MFKVGDKVKKIIDSSDSSSIGWEDTGIIVDVLDPTRPYILWSKKGGWYTDIVCLQLISSAEQNKAEENKMNIKEKFVLAFQKEPEKSFRKAEITNGDGFLTTDGQQVFLGYLLKKFGEDFKKEVVDDLLKEDEKK